MAKPRKRERKPKKKKKKKPIYALYEVEGEKLGRKGKSCPKCGEGVFMGGHKDRWVCGRCGYVEYKGK